MTALAMSTCLLSLTWGGCSPNNEACSWLFAPPSFIDADQPACVAEPAGQTCDASTGRCVAVCPPNEYLLTCRNVVVSGPTIPVEELFGAGAGSNHDIECHAIELPGRSSGAGATFCCQCAR